VKLTDPQVSTIPRYPLLLCRQGPRLRLLNVLPGNVLARGIQVRVRGRTAVVQSGEVKGDA
jgi:hypothetical protein